MLEFNINKYIAVKLTDAGRAEHKMQYDELLKDLPKLSKYSPPKEDLDGWSKWQGWVLMNTFGHMIRMGCEQPFEATIRVDV